MNLVQTEIKAIGIKHSHPAIVQLVQTEYGNEGYAPFAFCSLNGRLSKNGLINALIVNFNAVLRGLNCDAPVYNTVCNTLFVPLDEAFDLFAKQDKDGLNQYLTNKHQTIKVRIQQVILQELKDYKYLPDSELEAFLEWRDNVLIAKNDYSTELHLPHGADDEYSSIGAALEIAEHCADTFMNWLKPKITLD
jgi:hypothetical protein